MELLASRQAALEHVWCVLFHDFRPSPSPVVLSWCVQVCFFSQSIGFRFVVTTVINLYSTRISDLITTWTHHYICFT